VCKEVDQMEPLSPEETRKLFADSHMETPQWRRPTIDGLTRPKFDARHSGCMFRLREGTLTHSAWRAFLEAAYGPEHDTRFSEFSTGFSA
jgi:hypothetical protein